MGFLRRKGTPSPADAIRQFWAWWTAEGAAACAAAVGDGRPESIADDLTARVHAIHPALAWELAAGQLSEHQLVVTAEGDAELRPVARRWVMAAPPADETWSYDDHRGPVAAPEEVVLQAPGAPEIAFAQVRVGARMDRARADVTVHHPAFPDLDRDAQLRVAFLALDATLGENDTELWVGEVTPSTSEPIDAFGLPALRALVENLRRQHVDADGRPRQWALLRGTGPGGPVVATARSPLHPLFGPLFTRHVAALVPYRDRTEGGLPGSTALDALRRLEESLERALGIDGLLVAHESSAGTRTFHVYVDPETDAVRRVKGVLDGWGSGAPRVKITDGDPGWSAVSHLR